MKYNLQNINHGYYITRDPFNKQGDFITAPEVSQMFGECVALWIWLEVLGRYSKRRFSLVELGAGRGTMMADVFRTLKQLCESKTSSGIQDKIGSIHIVETSPVMRKIQNQTLMPLLGDIPIHWHDSLKDVTTDECPVLLANEFFDALPIHQFQFDNKDGWREIFVDIDRTSHLSNDDPKFKLCRHEKETPECEAFQKLPPRFTSLKDSEGPVEVSFDSISTMIHMATLFKKHDIAAGLIIDYGRADSVPVSSLRGIRQHKFTSPLDNIGETDLSADVDFECIKAAAERLGLLTHGPITQAKFLEIMGINELAERLKRACKDDVNASNRIDSQRSRLTSIMPNGMGKLYQVLVVKHSKV